MRMSIWMVAVMLAAGAISLAQVRADDSSDDQNSEEQSEARSSDKDRSSDSNRDDRENSEDRDKDRQSDADSGISFSKADRGIEVSDLDRPSQARDFGLREGDVVLSVNGQRVDSSKQFRRLIQNARSTRLPLTILRDDQRYTIWWQKDDASSQGSNQRDRRSASNDRNRSNEDSSRDASDRSEAFLGIVLDPRYDAAVVRSVYRNSPAQAAGLRAGDTILCINGEMVSSGQEVAEVISDMQPGERVELQVTHAPPRVLDVQLSTRIQQHRAAYRGESDDWQTQRADRADYDRGDTNAGQRRFIRRTTDSAGRVIDRGFEGANRVINRD